MKSICRPYYAHKFENTDPVLQNSLGSAEKFLSFGETVNRGRFAAITATNEIAYVKSLFPFQCEKSGRYATTVTSFYTNTKISSDLYNWILITQEQQLAYVQVNHQPVVVSGVVIGYS